MSRQSRLTHNDTESTSPEESSYALRLSMIKVRKGPDRVCQGDIFRDIEYIEYATEKDGNVEISKISFPLVIVLTQDCDLEQDYRSREGEHAGSTQDKWLLSVLVAPLYNADHVYRGKHLSELDLTMQQINDKKTPGKYLRNNQIPRYHYLEFPDGERIAPSIIDFKHYFSVDVRYLHEIRGTNYVCSVSSLYREDISQRFSNFLARIGLPEARDL